MDRKGQLNWAPRIVIIALLSLGLAEFDSQSSFAGGCGGYCKARQVRAFCHEAVRTKGLEDRQRDVEFERCKDDPTTRRRIEQLADDGGQSFE